MENIILPFYVFGHLVIINIAAAIVFKASGYYNLLIGMTISIAYLLWAAVTFYQPQNKILGALKMLLVYLLSYLCFMILMALLGIIVGVVIGLLKSA